MKLRKGGLEVKTQSLRSIKQELNAEYRFAKRNKLPLGQGHRDNYRRYKRYGGKLSYSAIIKK